jgi:hypothetical protein
MTHISPRIYPGSQKVCGMLMDLVLSLFYHLERLNSPTTCLVGVVPAFVSCLTGGDQNRGAGQDLTLLASEG